MDIPTDVITDQLASLSFIGVPKGSRKKVLNRLPWKPRLRCLYYLLCHLVAQEQAALTEHGMNTENGEGTKVLQSGRLRKFANFFLPEVIRLGILENYSTRKQRSVYQLPVVLFILLSLE